MVAPFRPAIFIGVTGNMDLRPGEDASTLRTRLRQFLTFLKPGDLDRSKALHELAKTTLEGEDADEVLAAMRAWPTLDATPVVLLTSLAPGADTIAAEVVLDLRDEARAKSPGAPDEWSVLPALPFPPEVYVRSQTFRSEDPQHAASDAERIDAFHRLLKRCEAGSDAIVVRTADDAGLSPVELASRYEADLQGTVQKTLPTLFAEGDSRQSLRFYAAGEYVAAHSHVLIAIWDDGAGSLGKGGTADVVDARLNGPRFGVLQRSNGIVMPHGGPLLHLYVRRRSNEKAAKRPVGGWRWLGPYSELDVGDDPSSVGESHDASAPHAAGSLSTAGHRHSVADDLGVFGRSIAALDEFNGESDPEADRQIAAWEMRKDDYFQAVRSRAGAYPESYDDDKRHIDEFADGAPADLATTLSRTLLVRNRAEVLNFTSDGISKTADRNRRRLFLLAFVAALCFHLFAEWHTDAANKAHYANASDDGEHDRSAPAHGSRTVGEHRHGSPEAGHEGVKRHDERASAATPTSTFDPLAAIGYFFDSLLQPIWGVIALVCGVFGLIHYWTVRPRRLNERKEDYRALAEALRVQTSWNLAGLGDSVPANYMNRQRNEMDWLRGAVRATSIPYYRWRDEFARMSKRRQIGSLLVVLYGWIVDQREYFRGAAERERRVLHAYHDASNVLACATIVTAILLVAVAFRHEVAEYAKASWLYFFALGALIVVLLSLFRRPDEHDATRGAVFRRRGGPKLLETLSSWLVLRSGGHGHGRDHARLHRSGLLGSFGCKLPASIAMACFYVGIGGALSSLTDHVPSFFTTTVVIAAMSLLSGAALLAWAEKNHHSEQAYQYDAMLSLFDHGARRARSCIDRLKKCASSADPADTARYDATLEETHEFIRDLGIEALDENAEWLILHRARPLEPVVV